MLAKFATDTIHLVHEADPGNSVLISLSPHRLRLRLDPSNSIKNGHGAIENAEGALYLRREVNVPWGVNDVDPMVAPEAGGRRGSNSDTPLLLLLHPIHNSCAVVHLAQLVGDPRVIQDTLGGRRLPSIYMRHDADVPRLIELDLPWHDSYFARTGFRNLSRIDRELCSYHRTLS